MVLPGGSVGIPSLWNSLKASICSWNIELRSAWGLKTLSWSRACVSRGCFVLVEETAEDFVAVDIELRRANGYG